MHLRVTILISVTIGLLPALTAGPPEPSGNRPAPSIASPANEVVGEPWSAPAHPVACREMSRQVVCTPTTTSEVSSQACFLGVLYNGERSTVCTTFEPHRDSIRADGGKEVLVAYGCSLGDVVCLTFENAGRGMAIATTAVMYAVADNMRFDSDTLLWSAAVTEWSFWQWAILAILLIAMIWAVTAAIVSGDRSELFGALVRSFLAFPAMALSLWLTGHVLNAVDELTWYVMNRNGPIALFATLQDVMWAGGEANYFFGFLIHGLLLIGMLLLMLVFAFRNIALAALIAVGPIAWMMFPVKSVGPQWVVRYFSAVAVLLLTAPLTIGFVTLIVNGLASVDTIWNPQAWPMLIGLAMVAFAPFAIFGLFSFAGAVAADSIGSGLGSRAGRATSSAARSVASLPSRLGARPAGITAGHASRGSVATAAAGSTARAGGRSPATLLERTRPNGAARPGSNTGQTDAKASGARNTPSGSGSNRPATVPDPPSRPSTERN